MALATTCPRCGTSFKVVADQLKLRGGLVRCGVCRHVFSGVDALRPIDGSAPAAGARTPIPDAESAPAPDAPPSSAVAQAAPRETETETETPAATAAMHDATADADATRGEAEAEPVGDGTPPPTDRQAEDTPAVEATPIEATSIESPPIEQPPTASTVAAAPAEFVTDHVLPGAEALRPGANESWRLNDGRGATDEADAVDFFGGRETARGFSSRGVAFAWFGSFLLAVLLALQVVLGARDWIAAWLPAARPILAAAVAPLGLQVMPPRAIDALTIESFELQESGAAGAYRISALIRNRAPHAVRWPSLELTLVDEQGTVVARRVLSAADYLGADSPSLAAGVGAKSELPIRGAIETRDLAPTGYSVKVFYP